MRTMGIIALNKIRKLVGLVFTFMLFSLNVVSAQMSDYESYQLEYNYAKPAGKNISFYSSSDCYFTNHIATVRTDKLSKPYIRLLRKTETSFQTTDKKWVKKSEVKPFYPIGSAYDKATEPEILNSFFPSKGIAFNDTLEIYGDRALKTKPVKIYYLDTFQILKRRMEGYPFSQTEYDLPYYYEVFYINYCYNNKTKNGWIKGGNIVKMDSTVCTHPVIAQGVVGIRYCECAGGYGPLQHTWAFIGNIKIMLGDCFEFWFNPDSTYLMANFYLYSTSARTMIYNLQKNSVFETTMQFTSPAWYNSVCFVRGMYEDDGVYVIDLKTGHLKPFFKIPKEYDNRPPDFGSGDGYYAYPAVTINRDSTISIRFDRHGLIHPRTHDVDYDSYLLAITDMNGRLLKVIEKTGR